MPDLFSALDDRPVTHWLPEAPPSLDGVREICLDTETNGLRWWAGHRPIGIAVWYNGRKQYLPWGHQGGGNLPEDQVKRWALTELRGKRITNLNIRFDIHMLREWGVDLEALGCEVSDVSHYAALLDDHRQHFSLESIAQDYLGIGKLGENLDKTRMASYHAGEVAAYACQDVELVAQLKEKMWPKLTAEGLHEVRSLEDQFIYVVCEMEKNGERIDVELLDRWVQESQSQLHKLLLEIMLETGIGNFNPSSPKDMERLFQRLKLPIERTEAGRPSFTSAILKTHIQHPLIEKVLRAVRLTGLRSKYLLPYAKTVDRTSGIIRFSLHQLRAIKDEHSERSVGTISGRCSVTKVSEDEGFPMQGVMKPEKQIVTYGDQFIIRQLHMPDPGMLRLSSDAMQVEYRLFAHETNSPRLLKIFEDDPLASFHKKTHEMFLKSLPNLTYRRMKDTNFACVPPETPILRSDLQWVSAGSLSAGDELLAFDENQREGVELYGREKSRRWQISTVLENLPLERECLAIHLENNETLISTVDHPWLVTRWTQHNHPNGAARGTAWIRSQDLVVGDSIHKITDVTHREESWEAGWIGGFLDGEGCVQGVRGSDTLKHACGIAVGQNRGDTFEFAKRLLYSTNYEIGQQDRSDSEHSLLLVRGNIAKKLQFLSQFRPERLVKQYVKNLAGRAIFQTNERIKVKRMERIGLQLIAGLGTSTHTYIAGGYAAHNTIYGAGLLKKALMLDYITKKEWLELTQIQRVNGYDDPRIRDNPKLKEVRELNKVYEREIPESGPLQKRAIKLAENRGYICSILGRRSRFPGGARAHKALNTRIQPSGADIVKQKGVELHAIAKSIGFKMRLTVHDEFDGDIPSREEAKIVANLLNQQSFKLRVPILWETSVGPNWYEQEDI